MGRKQWVKQQVQQYQDYVRVVRQQEMLDLTGMVKQFLEFYARAVIKIIIKTKRITVRIVVL
jgi:hypothetical protein